MDSNHHDEESTFASETTPLIVNTHHRREPRETSWQPSPANSSLTTLTATTYESSSNTLNDTATEKGYSFDTHTTLSKEDAQPELPNRNCGTRIKTTFTLVILSIGLVICLLTLLQYIVEPFGIWKKHYNHTKSKSFESKDLKQTKENNELFDEFGRYIIQDYDALPPFSDFLPGVAGIYGKPLWSFYINRGQGIASFGVESKDSPIMEFHSANNAYQNTALLGFRTFYKFRRGKRAWGTSNEVLVEPFSTAKTRFEGHQRQGDEYPTRTMYIGANEMQVTEIDHKHKIETNVTYFVLPEEDFGAFVKRTTVANLGDSKLHLSMLDGLPRIQPVGGKLNGLLKTMGRTLEGFMRVYQADGGTTMPYYRLTTETGDGAAIVMEEAGNFVLSYIESQEHMLLPIVYDTSKMFGQDTTLMWPYKLEEVGVRNIVDGEQYGAAKTSSAFSAIDSVTIYPGESITVSTFYGKAKIITDVPVIARRVAQGGFVEYKLRRARELIEQISAGVETNTKNKLFDAHVQQMYLDNSLRGGIPILLGEVDDDARSASADDDNRLKAFHLFSRIHGDLERDYNDFVLTPTYFSQGPGNFRDVAQNRRNDVIINPRIGSHNVKLFLSLIQADGYNPLSVEAVVFSIDDVEECEQLAIMAVGPADGHRKQREALANILCDGPWRPGQLANMIEDQNVFLLISFQDFINAVTSKAKMSPMAVSKDGFWADHWTYIMDLVYSYLRIYPDKEEQLLFDERLPYFFNPRISLPRHQKYVLSKTFDGRSYHVRQLKASIEDKERLKQMKKYRNNSSGWYDIEANYQHDDNGNIFWSSPLEKLFLLGTLKFATRDPLGMGIEYEGGKPGWNDAMNGLVGMGGSGMPETFELKVLLTYIQKVSMKYQRPIRVPDELDSLIDKILTALDVLEDTDASKLDLSNDAKVPAELFNYWDAVASAREMYRNVTTIFSGKTREYSSGIVYQMVTRWLSQLDHGIERALSIGTYNADNNIRDIIPPTYFSFNITRWNVTGNFDLEGHHYVNATEMVVNTFPLFLEGPVRLMKTIDLEDAKQIYDRVKASGLHDDELMMYTLSASLVGQSYDMGRMMAFPPGWLENQSVWLHMSYKYYLEILRKGMYQDFFKEMQSGMLPFIETKTYGRSPAECSSFIASSAYEDPNIHGRGFLARLSGSTAELLSIWALMMIGPTPFFINKDTNLLEMQLVPTIPSWLLQRDEAVESKLGQRYYVEFKLFTSISVVYSTDELKDLFELRPRKYKIGLHDGSIIKIDGSTIPNNLALKIRRVVFIDHIHAYF